jgi:hypothetical protein
MNPEDVAKYGKRTVKVYVLDKPRTNSKECVERRIFIARYFNAKGNNCGGRQERCCCS